MDLGRRAQATTTRALNRSRASHLCPKIKPSIQSGAEAPLTINQPIDAIVTQFVTLARVKLERALSGEIDLSLADVAALREQLEPYMPKPTMRVEVSIVPPADKAQPGAPSGAV